MISINYRNEKSLWACLELCRMMRALSFLDSDNRDHYHDAELLAFEKPLTSEDGSVKAIEKLSEEARQLHDDYVAAEERITTLNIVIEDELLANVESIDEAAIKLNENLPFIASEDKPGRIASAAIFYRATTTAGESIGLSEASVLHLIEKSKKEAA